MKAKLRRMLATLLSLMDAFELKGEEIAEDKFAGDTVVHQAAQVGTVIAVVAIGVTAAVGILIYSQVNQSLEDPANDQLNQSQASVTDGFGSAMELVPTVLIVLVASLVIGIIQRLRG
jgi:hypothetical protein